MELKLIQPDFDSPLTDLIIDLDHLRRKELSGTTPPKIFFQLKRIFHTLESIGSARIEGNNTTVAAFIETKIEDRPYINEDIQEIRNIEEAMEFIDESAVDRGLSKSFIKELHSFIVRDLTPPPSGEGDQTPGMFRNHAVEISDTSHVPPITGHEVEALMEELVEFISHEHPSKYDLLKVALAHHRFMWIHPFGNGNGRTGRLLTYAMLVHQGFRVDQGRILNPTAVFCIDRDMYNSFLSQADTGSQEGLDAWCQYVLRGLKEEIDKIDRLINYEYLTRQILKPAVDYALTMKYISDKEYKVLRLSVEKRVIQNSDLQPLFPGMKSQAISRIIRELKVKKMLEAEEGNSRSYHISFTNNFLIRGIIPQLAKEGFIPVRDEDS